jgi:hypothetical protein
MYHIARRIPVGPQIGMSPILVWGLPDLEYWHIPTHTDMGSPHISMGIALFLLFSVTHKIGLFSPNRQQHSKHFYSDPHF